MEPLGTKAMKFFYYRLTPFYVPLFARPSVMATHGNTMRYCYEWKEAASGNFARPGSKVSFAIKRIVFVVVRNSYSNRVTHYLGLCPFSAQNHSILLPVAVAVHEEGKDAARLQLMG